MIHFIYADDLQNMPNLRDSMLRDRAVQFRDRLGWDVTVDDQGRETDQYDICNPLYVIATDPQGRHWGSLRLLPTTGPTMANDHFADLIGGGPVQSPLIWECTRFCLAPGAPRSVAALLMLASGKLLTEYDLQSFIGVFDLTMLRVYRCLGATPEVIGASDTIGIGFWSFTPDAQARLARRAGVTDALITEWFERDL